MVDKNERFINVERLINFSLRSLFEVADAGGDTSQFKQIIEDASKFKSGTKARVTDNGNGRVKIEIKGVLK